MDEQPPTGSTILDGHEGNTCASQLPMPASGISSAALKESASATVFGIIELAELVLESLPVEK
jgi:hypothetical protein